MVVESITTRDLRNFIDEYAGDYYSFMLILFFAAFPNAGFSREAIVGSSGSSTERPYLCHALSKLVEHKVTDVNTNSAVPVYRLGNDSLTRNRVIEIGKLDFAQKKELMSVLRSA